MTSLYQSALCGCAALSSITLPACSQFDQYAMSGCAALTAVSLPLLEDIGRGAFQGCAGLTNVTLPAVQTLSSGAFSGCTGLLMISMSALTKFTGSQVFAGCTKLKSVYIGQSTASSNIANVFADLTAGYTIYVPSAKLAKYQTSAGWSAFSASMAGY